MKISPKLLAVCALSFAVACGGSTDPKTLASEGSTALNSRDYQAALEKFDGALATLDPATDAGTHLKASLGKCRALAHIDAGKAKTEFLALVDGGKVEYTHYSQIAVDFAGASAWNEAIEVLSVGKEKLPGEEKMEKLVTKIGDLAKKDGASSEAMKALEGLGYVGN